MKIKRLSPAIHMVSCDGMIRSIIHNYVKGGIYPSLLAMKLFWSAENINNEFGMEYQNSCLIWWVEP